jgi:hypothetical protein
MYCTIFDLQTDVLFLTFDPTRGAQSLTFFYLPFLAFPFPVPVPVRDLTSRGDNPHNFQSSDNNDHNYIPLGG